MWALYTLLLQLNLDCSWHLPPCQSVQRLAVATDFQLLWRISCVGAQPLQQDLLQEGSATPWVYSLSVLLMEVVGWWCFIVVWNSTLGALTLELSGRCKVKIIHCFCFARPIQHKLQSNLQMAATFVGLGGAQERKSYEPRQVAASAKSWVTCRDVQGILRLDVACFRDFKKIWSMSQDRSFIWKYLWKQHGWTCRLGVEGPERITRVGKTVLARLMETQIWCPPAGPVPERLIKGTMTSTSVFVWERASSPALTLMPDNSVFLCMSLAPFKLLPLYWRSEGVTPSKSVCKRFRRTLGVPEVLCVTQP